MPHIATTIIEKMSRVIKTTPRVIVPHITISPRTTTTPTITITKKCQYHKKRKITQKGRPGFILTGPIMLGLTLMGFVVFVSIMALFTGMIQHSLLDAITTIPTIHVYDKDGKRISIISDEVNRQAAPLIDERKILDAELIKIAGEPTKRGSVFAPSEQDHISSSSSNNNDRVKVIKIRQNEINQQLQDIGWYEQESSKYTMYRYFAYPVTSILVLVIIFTIALHFWEKGLQLVRPGTAISMFKHSVFGIAIIWIMPEIWDIFAILMTDFAVLVLDPITEQPQATIDGLWCKLGAASGCIFDFAGLLNPVSWATALANPADFGQTLLGEILLPFFMMTPALTISIGIFAINVIRIFFIDFMLISLPVWILLMLIPYVKSHAKQYVDGLLGASLAPFLTALTLFIGWTYVSNTPIPSIEEWMTVIAIISLAVAWPATLVPIVGRASSEVSGALRSAITSTSMMSMQMGMGMGAGALAGATNTQGHGPLAMLKGMGLGMGNSMIGAMPAEVTGGIHSGQQQLSDIQQSGLLNKKSKTGADDDHGNNKADNNINHERY